MKLLEQNRGTNLKIGTKMNLILFQEKKSLSRLNYIMEFKIFRMIRNGQIIANGCIFPSGKCVICWEGLCKSVVVWDSFEDAKKVNGHSNTEFFFLYTYALT